MESISGERKWLHTLPVKALGNFLCRVLYLYAKEPTVAKTLEDGPESSRFQEYKQSGDALLAKREAERKATAKKTAETEAPVSESAEIHPVHHQP